MNTDLIYVYCLANSPPEPVFLNDFQDLTLLSIDRFNVVVKYVSVNDFSEENFKRHLSDLVWLESNAREHFGVIRRFMEYGDMITGGGRCGVGGTVKRSYSTYKP